MDSRAIRIDLISNLIRYVLVSLLRDSHGCATAAAKSKGGSLRSENSKRYLTPPNLSQKQGLYILPLDYVT